MKEFAHSKKAYAVGWSRQHTKRREFLSGLIEIIQAHAFRGFASAVQTKVFKELCSDPDVLAHYPNEYVYCGRSVVGKARLWARSEGFKLPMQSVFECGDYGWGALVKTLRRDGHPEPIRKPKKPTNKQDEQDVLAPLQAGDFCRLRDPQILSYCQAWR
jgi:hypothetical protein